MKKFLVAILEDIPKDVYERLQAEEIKIVGGWRAEGFVTELYFRADDRGLFAIMHAGSADDVMDRMKALVFYPYMEISVVEVK